jgi:hypothetical protein
MSDNGGEFLSKEFQAHLKDSGIVHYTSIPYSPAQNGIAERAIRTLNNGARAMLHGAGFPKRFWLHAVKMKAYLQNRSPIRPNDYDSPYERWYGKVPDLSNLRIFGSPLSVMVHREGRLKWDERSHLCYLVGYEAWNGGYLVWDPVAKKEIRVRDVVFHEDAMKPIVIPKVEEVKKETESASATDDGTFVKHEPSHQPITIRLPGRLPQSAPAPAPAPAEPVTPEPPVAPALAPVHDVAAIPDLPARTNRSGMQRSEAAGLTTEVALLSRELTMYDVAFSVTTGKPLSLKEAVTITGDEGKAWREAAYSEWEN